MTVGMSSTRANALLNTYRSAGASVTAAAVYLDIHTGDPGSAGTTALATSAPATRPTVTFAAASAGSMALSSMSGTIPMTATETISHVSIWSASSAGTFLGSGSLSVSRSVINGDTLSITSLTLAFTPIAA